MRLAIVRIGNSRGLRIPKALLEAAGIEEQVDLTVEDHRLVVTPVTTRHPREGWAEAFAAMAAAGDDALLDPETPTEFDDTEWAWPKQY